MKKVIAIIGLFASAVATVSAAYFNTAPITRCEASLTHTIRRGSENNDVWVLQNFLSRTGYLSATPNGYFGYQTQGALKTFQYQNYLAVTGYVDASTRDAINERLCDGSPVTDEEYYGYSYDGYTDTGYGFGYTSPTSWSSNDRVIINTPVVKVVTPPVSTAPAVYSTPQAITSSFSPTAIATVSAPSVPVSVGDQILGTGIVYNPTTGYTYGITPRSGSITVASPVAHSVYQEGDTVQVAWTTNNLPATSYTVSLESSITGQTKIVATVPGNNYSFVLTKELLDAVCVGVCNNNQQGSFKVVVSLPTTDIAGNNTTLKAAISPITIRRPLAPSQVSITGNKSPVNSGEVFKLYINIPTGASWNSGIAGNYSIKIRAVCPGTVTASIAGTACGQDFVIPLAPTSFQQEIPASIINPTWYKQDVTFELTVQNLLGQTIGTATTKITANGAPFSW